MEKIWSKNKEKVSKKKKKEKENYVSVIQSWDKRYKNGTMKGRE